MLQVVGNQLTDEAGQIVMLRGMARPVLQWSITGQGAGKTIDEQDFMEIASHKCNTVRLCLELNWLSDLSYLAIIDNCVQWSKHHGLYIILDMQSDFSASIFFCKDVCI